MSRLSFRFCSIAVPDQWEPLPGLGAARLRRGRPELVVRVQETAPSDPLGAAAQMQALRELLEASTPAIEVVGAGPVAGGDGLEAEHLVYRFDDTELGRRWCTEVIAARGAVTVRVTLEANDDDLSGQTELMAIADSLRLDHAEHLAGAHATEVLPAAPESPMPEPERWCRLPGLCLDLPVPAGWRLTPEPTAAELTTHGAAVRVARLPHEGTDASAWLEQRLAELRSQPRYRVLGWQEGALGETRRFAALRVDGQSGGTWNSQPLQQIEMVTDDDGGQVLSWRLTVERHGWWEGGVATLLGLLGTARYLDPEEWETTPAEPWLEVVLKGPWRAEGPGLYLRRNGRMMCLFLGRVRCDQPLERVRPTLTDIIDGVRNDAAVLEVATEHEVHGVFRGLEAFRFSVDASIQGQGATSVRSASLLAEDELYTCSVSGAKPETVHALFLEVLEGLRLPGMSTTEQDGGAAWI